MKSAFTIIELVFVIVILGILIGIAAPRLSATRDDAAAVKASTEIRDTISQLSIFYMVNGSFPTGTLDADITTITAPSADINAALPTLANVITRTSDKWTACISITPTGDGAIRIDDKSADTPFCKALVGIPAVKEWINNPLPVGGNGIFGG